MTWSAPNCDTNAKFRADAVVVTCAPRKRASCIAKMPTAPAPPCTSTCSPAWSPARSNSPCHAVNAPIGTEAASICVKRGGFWATLLACVTQCSAIAASANQSFMPYTSWPISKPAVSPPTAAMTPENSCPGTAPLRFSPSRLPEAVLNRSSPHDSLTLLEHLWQVYDRDLYNLRIYRALDEDHPAF